ncbi:protein ABHD15 [Bufo bufo]|uniref:protein ABHD15 n=1 Tax=Bufo bufo TaxID=8384 RepID=UPI001ABE9515|nr:protein ABHD15 [Bufo bufo]
MFSIQSLWWIIWSRICVLISSISKVKFCSTKQKQECPVETEEEDCFGDDFGDSWDSLPEGYQLICKPSALAHWLLKDIQRFILEPTRWWWVHWPNVQTLVQHILPPDNPLELARENLQLTDGGIIALDWVVGPRQSPKPRSGTNVIDNPPLLLVIPNPFGKLTRNVQQLCLLALGKGYYPVIFNRRGQNDCPLTTLRLQDFGEPGDLKEAVNYIRFRHPSLMLFAVSEGLGSGLLLSYLGECGSSSYMTAVSCISPVFRCQEWFETRLPWYYEWPLLHYQKAILSRYFTALGEVVSTDKLFGSNSLQELHETLHCQYENRKVSWDSYWERNEPLRDVDEVAVPVLCICSMDDPIRGSPQTTLPIELFRTNPYFLLLLTHHGGHCGFLTESPTTWSHEVTLDYFRSVTEFFRTEEKKKWFTKRRNSNLMTRRRRPTLQRRETAVYKDLKEEIFNWKRSYTR